MKRTVIVAALLAALFSFQVYAQTSVTLWTNGTPVGPSNPLPVTASGSTATVTYANDTTTGTLLNGIAKANGLGGAVETATTDAANFAGQLLGVVTKNAGKSGFATIQSSGAPVSVLLDNAATAGDIAILSSTTAGEAHDSGTNSYASLPAGSMVVGTVITSGSCGSPPCLFQIALSLQLIPYPIGTSGATVPLLNGSNTWSGPQTFSSTKVSPGNSGNVNVSTALSIEMQFGGL